VARPVAASTVVVPPHPCTHGRAPTTYDHVVVLWLENRSYTAVAGSASWRNVNKLGSLCAAARSWSGASHPSLPNYLAAVSGSTGGVSSDCGPFQCPQRRPSIFGTLTAAGLTWRTY